MVPVALRAAAAVAMEFPLEAGALMVTVGALV
jgi:hypothetical protein